MIATTIINSISVKPAVQYRALVGFIDASMPWRSAAVAAKARDSLDGEQEACHRR
jgi:hypothetical protein